MMKKSYLYATNTINFHSCRSLIMVLSFSSFTHIFLNVLKTVFIGWEENQK